MRREAWMYGLVMVACIVGALAWGLFGGSARAAESSPAAMAPEKPAPFEVRVQRVQEAMRKEQVDFVGYALYDAQGRPVMTQDGRHAVRIVPVDLAAKQ